MKVKLGFWATLGLVIGSQIGSGVFMLPASLAPYGIWGAVGWLISGTGAICLAMVFATLCRWYPQTGGVPIYVREAFGPSLAFFTGWTYWVISWVSSTAVVAATFGYLSPFLGASSPFEIFLYEVLLVILILRCNLQSVEFAGRLEFGLTILKVIPLLIFPVVACFYFQKSNLASIDFFQLSSFSEQSHILSTVTMVTLWGFIGVESAATPAGEIHNPQKTIPRAIIWGTCSVAFLYLINSLGIMGLVPASELAQSGAPYVDAAQRLFGGNMHLMVSIVGALICIGTLNAWVLASGQIALGLSQENLMPSLFKKTNKKGAPVVALLMSGLGMIPFLYLMMNKNISEQIFLIIDFSVVSFLFVYFIAVLSFFKIAWRKKKATGYEVPLKAKHFFLLCCGGFSVLFCGWIIIQVQLPTLLAASLFTLSGLPVFWWQRRRF